jgi:uncharacterized FlaG/YvyC family protein
MTEKCHQHSHPAEFGCFQPDHWHGIVHQQPLALFSAGICFSSELRFQPHDGRSLSDKKTVSPLLKHAEEIFATAREGMEDCQISILVGGDGAIHMLPAADWELEPLRMHYGAHAAYRVSRSQGQVRVEGRTSDQSCTLRTPSCPPPHRLLPEVAHYQTIF